MMVTIVPATLLGQNKIDLTALTAFQNPSANWHISGDVRADLKQNNSLILSNGTGVLVTQAGQGIHGQDLLFNTSHGDMDLELDYMMAKGSNSGIYLQGRYEIQLLDSWSVVNPKPGDNGGIYERWNEDKPEGQKGYEGHAPRQNASRAPGLWQHIKISFQAPRFNASGLKIENARILRVELNGVSIQENVELSGPTRGALQNDEVASGPLRFQGDHGTVAFRNIILTAFDKQRPELLDIKYAVYKGNQQGEPDFKKLPPEAQGTSVILSSNVSNLENEFLIRYTGTLRVKEAGAYNFNLNASGGSGSMTINNKIVLTAEQRSGRGKIILPAGDLPFQLLYSKVFDYAKPALGLSVAGPGIREYLISDGNVASGDPVDPILINATTNTILRSFMDIDTIRVTHAVSVGSPQQMHYTYDMDKGMIVQVWRGGFLDATPMWHSRGDGSSRPSGSVIRFGKPMMALQTLNSPDAAWSADTAGTAYRPKGYRLDGNDRPTFPYQIYNTLVNDVSRVMDNNQGIHREISIENPVANLWLRLAEADIIETISEDLYLINDKSYYLQIDDAATVKPVIRDSNGHKELIVPIQKKISYSILF
ncbi:MAG: family 16 glycoside hydrolase [Chitinophagaceae bacterium]